MRLLRGKLGLVVREERELCKVLRGKLGRTVRKEGELGKVMTGEARAGSTRREEARCKVLNLPSGNGTIIGRVAAENT